MTTFKVNIPLEEMKKLYVTVAKAVCYCRVKKNKAYKIKVFWGWKISVLLVLLVLLDSQPPLRRGWASDIIR